MLLGVKELFTVGALIVCDHTVFLALCGNLGYEVAVIVSLGSDNDGGKGSLIRVEIEVTSSALVVFKNAFLLAIGLNIVDEVEVVMS